MPKRESERKADKAEEIIRANRAQNVDSETSAQELAAHIHQDAATHMAPSVHKTPYLSLDSVGPVETEEVITLKAGNGLEIRTFTLKYNDDEIYQVFVWGGRRA